MKKPTMEQAIKRKCLECSGNSKTEVANCNIKDCPLYCYRLGEKDK